VMLHSIYYTFLLLQNLLPVLLRYLLMPWFVIYFVNMRNLETRVGKRRESKKHLFRKVSMSTLHVDFIRDN
jgi:hypothetical protein